MPQRFGIFFGSTDKYEKVDILTNIMTDAEGKNFVQYGEMAFLTQIHADAIDVVLMPEPLYESLKDEQLLLTFGRYWMRKPTKPLGIRLMRCI